MIENYLGPNIYTGNGPNEIWWNLAYKILNLLKDNLLHITEEIGNTIQNPAYLILRRMERYQFVYQHLNGEGKRVWGITPLGRKRAELSNKQPRCPLSAELGCNEDSCFGGQ